MRFQNVDKRRIFALNNNENISGPVLYWMTREQRADDNWGLILAQEIALHTETPLYVCFCLKQDIPERMSFQIAGLQETVARLQELNIPFYLISGHGAAGIKAFIDEKNIGLVVTDFFPLKEQLAMQKKLNSMLDIPFWEVDSHNIIPARLVSSKKETSVEAFRGKVENLLDDYLVEYLPLKKHSWNDFEFDNVAHFDEAVSGIATENDQASDLQTKPGTIEALNTLILFLEKKLADYADPDPDPDAAIYSNLSSYLHFGQIAAQRVALAVKKLESDDDARKRFLDNLIVRKELCDNFCLYETNYDNLQGAPEWARESLEAHRHDKREYCYSQDDFQQGRTHSNIWNAAHKQLMETGRLHWLLRKFWAAKIMEWSETPEAGIETANMLADSYSLDAPDPLGYAGVMQVAAGLYCQPVPEKEVTGVVPTVDEAELKEQLDLEYFLGKWSC